MRRAFAIFVPSVAVMCCAVAAQVWLGASIAPAQVADRTESGKLVTIPVAEKGVRFLVLGDSGTGDKPVYEIGELAAKARTEFPFDFALLLGDNLYGGESPRDFENKFEKPFKELLDGGVKFYASLGNHDQPTQTSYKLFNMNGKRYYTFKPAPNVRFFALDSNYMDKPQLDWLEKELSSSGSEWKVCFFHHPLYSSGEKHGPSMELRKVLEPLFLEHGVDLVLSGHEHFYERIKPQHGIYYFIAGSAAKLREGNIEATEITAKGYDRDRAFMLMQIAGDELSFQTINRKGETVDSGVLPRLRHN
jgi:predicted phosphodiesterase